MAGTCTYKCLRATVLLHLLVLNPSLTGTHTHTHYTFPLDTQATQCLAPGSPSSLVPPAQTHTHRSKQVSLGAGPDLWSLQSLTLSQLLAPLVSPESIPHHPASLTPDYHGWTSALITNLSTHGQTLAAQKAEEHHGRNTVFGAIWLKLD